MADYGKFDTPVPSCAYPPCGEPAAEKGFCAPHKALIDFLLFILPRVQVRQAVQPAIYVPASGGLK